MRKVMLERKSGFGTYTGLLKFKKRMENPKENHLQRLRG